MGRRLAMFLDAIKFQHTVFALPFAVIAAVLASVSASDAAGQLTVWKGVWILVCMVSARTAAMSLNRFADQPFDSANPRTQDWPTANGTLSRRFMGAATVVSLAIFFTAAGMLSMTCLKFAPLAALILLGYSYAKRFTWLCHLWLGVALGMACPGAWVAVRGSVNDLTLPLTLGAMVSCWVAGFDVIYACRDTDFDRTHHLFSFPGRFGVRAALIVSAVLHIISAGLLFLFIVQADLGTWSMSIAAIVGGLLAYEHYLVRPGDLSKLNAAFFTINGIVSIVLMAAVLLDIALK